MKVWLIFILVKDLTFPVAIQTQEFKTQKQCEQFIAHKREISSDSSNRIIIDSFRYCQQVIK